MHKSRSILNIIYFSKMLQGNFSLQSPVDINSAIKNYHCDQMIVQLNFNYKKMDCYFHCRFASQMHLTDSLIYWLTLSQKKSGEFQAFLLTQFVLISSMFWFIRDTYQFSSCYFFFTFSGYILNSGELCIMNSDCKLLGFLKSFVECCSFKYSDSNIPKSYFGFNKSMQLSVQLISSYVTDIKCSHDRCL